MKRLKAYSLYFCIILQCTDYAFAVALAGDMGECQKEVNIRVPMPGAFVPQCDKKGDYQQKQCNVNNRYCWCVDKKSGVMIADSLRQEDVDCEALHKKKCEKEASHVISMPGAFIPQCDKEGEYKPMQFHPSTGLFWCVHRNGTKIQGTEKQTQVSCQAHQKTKCEQEASPVVTMLGAFIPHCDEKGDYLPMQCSGSTGYCWCVYNNGAKIPGTLRHGEVNCKGIDIQKKCRKEAAHALITPMPGAFIPQCDDKGDYRPMQCHGSTGQCWCVNVNGDKILESEQHGPVNCKAHDLQTKCQKEASVKMIPGAFRPSCDEKGNYQPKQCHGSTGLCWCVNRKGEMSGTKQRGQLKCEEHAQTKCQKKASMPPVPGAFIPQCDEKGSYLPVQCHSSTGMCWCVDRHGKKIIQTQTHGEVNCEGVYNLTKCEKEAARIPFGIVGAYKPQCNENGHYEVIQCHSGTGYCWCAKKDGTKISGTETQGQPKCDGVDRRTKCEKEATKAASKPLGLVGAFTPECEENGDYKPKQCHSSTGFCWCARNNGEKIPGTDTREPLNCDGVDRLSKCEKEAASIPPGILGAFKPQCDADGHYELIQCHSSTGYCWCSTKNGTKIAGTHTRGQPNCDGVDRLSKCEKEVASIPPVIRGAFKPRCDADGHYELIQCHGSTGYCWCSTKNGTKIAGTETRGKPNCDGVDRLSKCEKEAASIPPGIMGAFKPQCDADGHYELIQCHSSTGYCWCSTKNGTKIAGTHTRGQPNCDGLKMLTKCQSEAARVPDGLIGAYKPQCDVEGNYHSKQCHASTGYCWCVNKNGEKILGTDQRGHVDCKK